MNPLKGQALTSTSRIIVAALAAGAAAAGWYFFTPQDAVSPQIAGAAMVAVTVPDLTDTEKLGEAAFNAKCAACHGKDAAGQNGVAPPLVHAYYRAGHHGDMAFMLAAQNGVTAHHWRFGNMPPVTGLTDGDMKNIIAYVRAVQQANGIN